MVEGTTLSVHRCRFVDFTPSAITALSFPPLSLPSIRRKKSKHIEKPLRVGTLAVGRANGNIELCEWTAPEHYYQAAQAWVVKKTLSGPYPSKVDSLSLTIRFPDQIPPDKTPACADLRLFSAGSGSDLAEWDIEKGCIRRTISSYGGSIWTISANPASTLLALGCEDGSVRILSLEYDTLTHLRRLDRVKSRILSIAWGPPIPRDTKKPSVVKTDSDTSDDDEEEEEEEGKEDWTDSWLVAGCSDSSLRKWDVTTGRVLDRMGTDKMRGERTLVWAVGVLGDGTIVSGDSLGMVKFWDSKTCTQLQSFPGHGADVLCLTISPEGTAVYTSGVDQKVTQFSYVKTSNPNAAQSSILSRSSGRWVQSFSRRMHSHDVRALAIWPPYSPLPQSHRRNFPLDVAPVLASGGLDMSVVVTPAAVAASTVTKVVNPLRTSVESTFEDAYHRKMAYSSGALNLSGLHLARQARLLLCTRDAGISLWRIKQKKQASPDELDGEQAVEDVQKEEGGWERVLDMDLNVHTNLVASAISDDGKWVVVSDWYETKLFHIEFLDNGDLVPRRIRDFTAILQSHFGNKPSASTGGSSFSFTPDSTKLIMATSVTAYILIIDLETEDGTPRVLRRFDHHRLKNAIVGGRVVKRKKKKKKKGVPRDVKMVDTDAEKKEMGIEDGDTSEEETSSEKTLISTITRMAVSPDGQWLATSDDHSRTYIYNLDSIQHHAILPSFAQPIHALSFDPSNPSTLILGLANNTIQIYDVESRQFPSWSRHLMSSLPQRFTQLHDPILGVTFDPGSSVGMRASTGAPGRAALFWGATWLCKVQLDAGVGYGGFEKKRKWDGKNHRGAPPPPQPTMTNGTGAGEDGQQSTHQQQNFKLITHYRPILFVDFIAPAELVVVERPLLDVLVKLPPAFFKPKYGVS